MHRFATIERLRTSPRNVAANDNSANSIYGYSSDVEDLLRRLHESAHPSRYTRSAFDWFELLRRGGIALSAIALVCCIPAGAGTTFLPKSENATIRSPAQHQVAGKGDLLPSPASAIGVLSPVEDAQPAANLPPDTDPFDLIRGSIADVSHAADRPSLPVSRKRPQKAAVADRTASPNRVTASPSPPPQSPSLFETVFSLRSVFRQNSPQT